MRLICPHCMSGVTVPDDTAGKEATCPSCGKPFPTPARYAAAVVPEAPVPVPPPVPPPAPPPIPVEMPRVSVAPAVPAPPPGLVPPTPPPAMSGFLPSAPSGVPSLVGYTKAVGITLSPRVVAWAPAVLLTAVLVLTFFPWVGCYASWSAVYSQRPWGALFGGSPYRNYKLEGTVPGGWLDKVHSDWEVLLPFFVLLLVALAFAWGDRVFRADPPRQVPPLARLWPWRNSIVAGCATLALVLILVQWMNGFGMERAIKQQIAEKPELAAQRDKAGTSRDEREKLEYAQKEEFDRYNVEHTTWMYLAITCNALAVLALALRDRLDVRGNKPPPRIVLHY